MKGLTKHFRKGNGLQMLLQVHNVAAEAFKNGHYLESVLIYFQAVELQLRLVLIVLCENARLQKIIDDEDRFFRLINYLDLLKPDNNLSERLRKFNSTRNKVVHNLIFSFVSTGDLNKKLKSLSVEALALIKSLGQLM